ncbi:Carboxypeptidase D [Balamuthia mandrillaris]
MKLNASFILLLLSVVVCIQARPALEEQWVTIRIDIRSSDLSKDAHLETLSALGVVHFLESKAPRSQMAVEEAVYPADFIEALITRDLVFNLDNAGYEWNYTERIAESEAEELVARSSLYSRDVDQLAQRAAGRCTPDRAYHTEAQLEAFLNDVVEHYPNIASLQSIGKTKNRHDIWALTLSDNPTKNEDNESEFVYIGNMHGDEIMGRQLLIHLITTLTSQYGSNPRITRLLDNIHITIIPTMNPEGYNNGWRGTHSPNVDLNRDFPDQYKLGRYGQEEETKAIMAWSNLHHPNIIANFHGGETVVVFPFDGLPSGETWYYSRKNNASPDDRHYRALALSYASQNPVMRNHRRFANGISNGAEWYPLYGSMGDWHYLHRGALELTIELTVEKCPHGSELQTHWDHNKESMLVLMEQSFLGVKGHVKDKASGKGLKAVLRIDQLQPVETDEEHGDYYRFLAPGEYRVRVSADGYHGEVRDFKVEAGKEATVLDIHLTKA